MSRHRVPTAIKYWRHCSYWQVTSDRSCHWAWWDWSRLTCPTRYFASNSLHDCRWVISESVNAKKKLRQNKFWLQRTPECQLTYTTLNWMSEFRDCLWSRRASVRGDVSCALRVDGPVRFFCHEVRICGEYNLCRERAHHLGIYVKRIRVSSSEEDLDIEISTATAFREFDSMWSVGDCQIIFKVIQVWWSERLFESSVQISETSINVLL